MIFVTLNPKKIRCEHLADLSNSDVATLPWEIQEKSFSTVLFIRTSDYFRYLRGNQIATAVLQLQLFTYCCSVLPVICIALLPRWTSL